MESVRDAEQGRFMADQPGLPAGSVQILPERAGNLVSRGVNVFP